MIRLCFRENLKENSPAKRFPRRYLPNKKTFQRLYERLRDTGSFKKRLSGGGKPFSVEVLTPKSGFYSMLKKMLTLGHEK